MLTTESYVIIIIGVNNKQEINIMIEQQGCGKNIDGWNRCGVMEMGGSLIYCKGCQPTIKPPLNEQVRVLREALADLLGASVHVPSNPSINKAIRLAEEALAKTK